ncbi:MAG: nucleotidyltransferase family protein [Salinivirgaceae bacterium]|nr:nucleotidyltransferase family protein [Salinivirgaceae bacterium]MBR5167435.1 nucleotidyltransferase family protein [Salinivirgaceae bacterium]
MKKSSVLHRLNSLKEQLSNVGVSQLGLFGSTVRGDNTAHSDIDILLDFKEGQETYVNFIDACQILEQNFKRHKLDVVTRNGMSPYIGKIILNEVEYV